MGKVAALISFSALLISGCAVQPPITNSQGQPVKYSGPVLSHDDFNGATYVLLEKNIADGKFHTISISKERQPIQNPRQERIVFSGDLTKFAPDYTAYSFSTYRDNGFYGQETVIMNCNMLTNKVSQYGPCDSAFSYVFIPTSVTNAYAAGRMSFSAHQQWENPRTNNLRGVGSPLWALRQSGALDEIIKRSPSVGAEKTGSQSSVNAPAVPWEKNNNWKFTDNFGTSQNTVIAEIRPAGTHWEIAGIYVAPPAVSHSQDAELFVVTTDLQNWRGYYKDHVVNCDSFEAHQHDEKTICTSQFGVKKVGAALAGILIGGNGKSYYTYGDDKVAAAIQSIRVSQALEKLDAFEKQ